MEDREISQDELFDREEKCQKAIRTVSKAIFMRLVVTALMIVVVWENPRQMWAWGLAAFVLLINTLGAVPLWQEYRRQKRLLKQLIAMEE